MGDTVFFKLNEGNKTVQKSSFNVFAFLFGALYFAFKKDVKMAIVDFLLCVVFIAIVDEFIFTVTVWALNGWIANHRLHRFYLEQGYNCSAEDQAWIDANVHGTWGRF